MTHEDQVKAYNMGWNMARNPGDPHFAVHPPRSNALRDYFYQGFDDARRSMLTASHPSQITGEQ